MVWFLVLYTGTGHSEKPAGILCDFLGFCLWRHLPVSSHPNRWTTKIWLLLPSNPGWHWEKWFPMTQKEPLTSHFLNKQAPAVRHYVTVTVLEAFAKHSNFYVLGKVPITFTHGFRCTQCRTQHVSHTQMYTSWLWIDM